MGLTRNTLAHEIDTMTNVVEVINTRNLLNVSLIVDEVWISLDGSFNSLEISTFLKLDINHAAMDACAYRDGHRESILDTFNSANGNRMSHRTAWTEVGV